MTLAPGTTIGRYQILEPLGQGGMATVYKAFQPSLQRELALKVLRPGYAQDQEFRERFEREAIAIAKLRHPHIIQVFDFEVAASGEYVLAMELLEGGTLKERLPLSGELLEQKEVVRIIGEVADALSYAHELGIVHRDIKPSNVMLTRRDRAVVTDFGIARILGATSHTQTGVGIGTPEYMAPEQGQGGQIDHRADIYSLGVMAYELLTGRVPFAADTPLAIVIAHIRDPLPLPSMVNPAVGPETEKALLRALAKDPADRYDAAIDFAETLKSAIADDATDDTTPTMVVRGATAATVVSPRPAAAAAGPAAIPAVPAPRPIATPPAGAAPATARGGIPRVALIGAAALVLLLLAGGAFALTRGTAPAVAGVLFELDPARGGQQLFARGPGVVKPVPNAIEVAIGPAQFVTFDLIPAVSTSDLDATMRVRLVSGSGRVGLFFHSAGDGNLQLALNTRGVIEVSRTDPKAPQPGPLATFPTGASLGKDVEMRLVVVGTAITVYADGKEVGRATSPSQRTGGIGILVGSFDSGVTAQVASLRILGTAVKAPVGAAGGAPGGGPGCAQPPCPPGPSGGQSGPPPQLTPGQIVALSAKGALIRQADLTTTSSVFGVTAQNRAVVRPDGLTLEARENARIGINPPPPPPPGSYGDVIVEVRASAAGGTAGSYELAFLGALQAGGGPQAVTYVHVSTVPGGTGVPPRLRVEIIHEAPDGAKFLAQGFTTADAGAHTVLVQRQGAQIAVFLNGRFAASATDPKPQQGGMQIRIQPQLFPDSRPPELNSVHFESWAIYATTR